MWGSCGLCTIAQLKRWLIPRHERLLLLLKEEFYRFDRQFAFYCVLSSTASPSDSPCDNGGLVGQLLCQWPLTRRNRDAYLYAVGIAATFLVVGLDHAWAFLWAHEHGGCWQFHSLSYEAFYVCFTPHFTEVHSTVYASIHETITMKFPKQYSLHIIMR